jgi:hypothetical protein
MAFLNENSKDFAPDIIHKFQEHVSAEENYN